MVDPPCTVLNEAVNENVKIFKINFVIDIQK